VRVIDENGEQIGVMAPLRALDLARERNLDLVEISPQAIPPVCKIMDFGRFKYETAKRENDARKRQKVSEVKEIRLHAHTDAHDIGVRVKKIVQFLTEGDKVKVSIQFKGREILHPELGRQMLESIVTQLKGAVVVERPPALEGRNMWMMLTRAPGWDPKKAADAEAAKAANEEASEGAQA
jgi:translation initiation factor IF-3